MGDEQGGTPKRPGYQGPTVIALLGIGSLCGVSVGLGVFLGVFADHEFGTTPLFAIVGLVLGLVGAAYGSYTVIRPYLRG